MSRAISSVLAVLLLLAAALPVAANEPDLGKPPAAVDAPAAPDRVIVEWRNPQGASAVASARGLSIAAESVPDSLPDVSVVQTNGRSVDAVVAELRNDPNVERVEPDYLLSVVEDPADGSVAAVGVNDPKTANQYSLNQMRVRDAWSISRGGSRVIAVLDTGVDATHPDLQNRLVAGYDFVDDNHNTADENGHGTWVAGIIAANPNNGVGVAGISWSDKIMPMRVMDETGSGSTSDVAFGIHWAVDHGAKIINMSIGGPWMTSSFLSSAIDYAWANNVVLVGATGNDAQDVRFYPASYPKVVSVSATQVNGEFSNWSNYGPDVDVSAPGASVLTTNCASCKPSYTDTTGDNRYTYISGTSFAAPNVSGVVALIWARYPSMTNAQVVERLKATVDDLGYGGWDNRYGHGRVNALRAVGGSSPTVSVTGWDSLEGNNTLSAAKPIALGATVKPNIYPAGDVDVFAVDAPRAGRVDVTVVPVIDDRAWPWNRSTLAVDTVLNVYRADGTHIAKFDQANPSSTDGGSIQMGAAGRLLLRVHNYTPNGNKTAYTIRASFVDNVAPVVTSIYPTSGATAVSPNVDPLATFNEPVTNVTAATVLLRDLATSATVPAGVSYDAATRRARISPSVNLVAGRLYRVELTSGVRDTAGNALATTTATFTTGTSPFSDIAGNAFGEEIDWLASEGITQGCTADRFCPKDPVTREQMASFLSRAMTLPATATDYFGDDETSGHEDNINRLAAAGVTQGCGAGRYCPKGTVTREQMASFLARALKLPASTRDFFRDDEQSGHEADINRVAAAGITLGCGSGTYCPSSVVTREQMAAFLYRAFAD